MAARPLLANRPSVRWCQLRGVNANAVVSLLCCQVLLCKSVMCRRDCKVFQVCCQVLLCTRWCIVVKLCGRLVLYVDTYVCVCVCACVRTYMRVCVRVCVCVRVRMRVCKCDTHDCMHMKSVSQHSSVSLSVCLSVCQSVCPSV